jgi:VIT1/CCC1 family predicted Fe2+/Mn2+ transporter
LEPKLAEQVADQLMAKDALDAHARNELAWTSAPSPNRSQAAFASALAFSLGEAAPPPLTAFLAPQGTIVKAVPAAALVFLAPLGAWAGGTPMVKPALRVGFWARWR